MSDQSPHLPDPLRLTYTGAATLYSHLCTVHPLSLRCQLNQATLAWRFAATVQIRVHSLTPNAGCTGIPAVLARSCHRDYPAQQHVDSCKQSLFVCWTNGLSLLKGEVNHGSRTSFSKQMPCVLVCTLGVGVANCTVVVGHQLIAITV